MKKKKKVLIIGILILGAYVAMRVVQKKKVKAYQGLDSPVTPPTPGIPPERRKLIAELQKQYDSIMRNVPPQGQTIVIQSFKSNILDPKGLQLIRGEVVDRQLY